jgi:hypothetical protein
VGFESSWWVSNARLDSGLRGGSGMGGGYFTGFAGQPRAGRFRYLSLCTPTPPPPWGCGKWFILQPCFSTVNQVLPCEAAFSVQRSAFRNPILPPTPLPVLTIEKLCGQEAGRAPLLHSQNCGGRKLQKKRTVAVDSPFPTVLMVTGVGRECKENRRVRGYEGTAIYLRYGEAVEWRRENQGALCAGR